MSEHATLRLTVPGALRYRDVAVRLVAEACRLVSGASVTDEDRVQVVHAFDTAFVSAFMEIFNNIALHAYRGIHGGEVDLVAQVSAKELTVELRDSGAPFNYAAVQVPELDALPEGGMGIHIAKSMLDELEYLPGPPNVWRMKKRLTPAPVAQFAHT